MKLMANWPAHIQFQIIFNSATFILACWFCSVVFARCNCLQRKTDSYWIPILCKKDS